MSIAIFDLDDTLIKGQSQRYLIKYLLKVGIINLWDYVLIIGWFMGYKIGLLNDPRPALSYALKFVRGKTVAEIDNIIDDFYQKVLHNKYKDPVVKKLKEHKDNFDTLVLLTNAVSPLAQKVAKELGINKCYATGLEIIDGKYSGAIEGEIIYAEKKADLINSRFTSQELADSYAYADHYSDIHLLGLVTHPVLVDPQKDSLKKIKNKLSNIQILNCNL